MAKKYSLESFDEKDVEQMKKDLVNRQYWHFKVFAWEFIFFSIVLFVLAMYSEGQTRSNLLTSIVFLLLVLGVFGVFTHLLAKSYERHLAKTKYPGGVTAIVAKRDNQ